MLTAEAISHSTQIEGSYKRLMKEIQYLKDKVREQYNLDWASFDDVIVEDGQGAKLEDSCLDIIFKRLDLWCKLDYVLWVLDEGQLKVLGNRIAEIRATEKECLERE